VLARSAPWGRAARPPARLTKQPRARGEEKAEGAGLVSVHVGIHVQHGAVQEVPDVRRLGVQDQGGQVEARGVRVLAQVGVRNGQVRPAASVVRLQLEALVVCDYRLLALPRVGQRGAELVPRRVIVRPQSASCSEGLGQSSRLSLGPLLPAR
jgi:hypothetical protein